MGGSPVAKSPHRARNNLCNFDYQVINYDGILNIRYKAIHFSLQGVPFSLVQTSLGFTSSKALSLSPEPPPAGLSVPGEFRSCSRMQNTFTSSEMPLCCRQLHLFHFHLLLNCKEQRGSVARLETHFLCSLFFCRNVSKAIDEAGKSFPTDYRADVTSAA